MDAGRPQRHQPPGREADEPLHGVVAEASVDASLVVRDAVLSSVRVLRDYQINRTYPPEVKILRLTPTHPKGSEASPP